MAKEPDEDDDDLEDDATGDEAVDDPTGETEESDRHDDESVDDPTGETGDADGHEAEFEPEDKPAKQTRGNRQFGALRRENRELKERLERVERGQQQNNPDAERLRREEEARLQYMSPEEKAAYHAQKDKQLNELRFQAVNFQLQDANDQRAFDRACRANPAIAALAEEVEDVLGRERAKGMAGAPRLAIAKYLLGDKALKAASRKKPKMQRQAESARRANATGGGANRSNVRAESGRGDDAAKRKKRLENVTF